MTEASLDPAGHALAMPDLGPKSVWARVGWGWDFIDLAGLGNNSGRAYLAALLRILLLPLGFVLLVGVGAGIAGGFLHANLAPARPFPQVAAVVAAFGSVIIGGVAVLRSVTRSHRRPWMSVISADRTLDWRRLAIGAGVEGVLMLGLLWFAHLSTGEPWRLPETGRLSALGLAFLLVPFQAASEEILFRGYLTQALGRVFSSRWKIVLAVGILFGIVHFNAYGPLTLPYVFILSLIYSLVSLRDGRIELTIGAHTAMNWVAIVAGSLPGPGQAPIRVTGGAVAILAVHGLVFYGLSRFFLRHAGDGRRAA